MASISGTTGAVAFTGGYVTKAFYWEIDISAEELNDTAFSPTGNYAVTDVGLISWRGLYRCRQHTNAISTLSGMPYQTNPHSWTVRLEVETKPDTIFTDTTASVIGGLARAEVSLQCWIDGTVTPPTVGTTSTGVFTIDTGKSYSIPLVVTGVRAEVSADAESRLYTITAKNTGSVEVTGTIPNIGTNGAATFTEIALQTYAGTIFVNRVEITCNRNASEGFFEIGFEGDGTLTPA